MKPLPLVLTIAAVLFTSCSARQDSVMEQRATQTSALDQQSAGKTAPAEGFLKKISFDEAETVQSATAAIDRKILKSAEVTMEVAAPADALGTVSTIAGKHGGFVVTSESKQRQFDDPKNQDLDMILVIRVPASQFEAALGEIRRIGSRILQNKETGQDVTEEFIDLEARMKTQKALEAQFLEIMKGARQVADALEVQRQVAEVRNEIERLEGRLRFLDNRASLSTITVNLRSPKVIVVSSAGVGQSVKDSVADSVAIASGIMLFLIRSAIVLIPILVLVVLPAALVVRYLLLRARKLRPESEISAATAE